MKKRTKIILGITTASLIGGGIYMANSETFSLNGVFMSKRDRQLTYLKEHEQEIVKFVKSQHPKMETVQIDWTDVRWFKDSNIASDEDVVRLYGTLMA